MSKKIQEWFILWGILVSLFLLSSPAPAASGKFTIVGMGTTPDLLTIRGAECVKQADIILLEEPGDQDAWKELIGTKEVWFLGHGSKIYYGTDPKKIKNPSTKERAVKNARLRQEIIEKIKAAVENGKNVAALQWGDPMMYGTTFYLEMLPKDFPSEIIPGVGAFQAASAAVKMSPPYGWDTSSVILTMTDWPGRADTNEKLMATRTSMVFYTMHLNYPKLFAQLKRHYPKDTPVAVVNNAGDRGRQKVLISTVGRFLEEINYKELPVEAHLLMVGKFLNVGQARKEGLASGKDFIKERYGEPVGEKK